MKEKDRMCTCCLGTGRAIIHLSLEPAKNIYGGVCPVCKGAGRISRAKRAYLEALGDNGTVCSECIECYTQIDAVDDGAGL